MPKFELVSASAGSGKTYSLVQKIKELIESGVEPNRIVAFTFTKAATIEIKERVNNPNVKICTMHSFFYEILKAENPSYRRMQILDDNEKERILKNIVYGKNKNALTKVKGLQSLNIKDQMLNITKKKNCLERPSLESIDPSDRLYYIYEMTKQELKKIDFDDQLCHTYDIFIGDNGKNKISKYQKEYDWILCDEFQDCSMVQVELIKLLVDNTLNLYCIGDHKQAIYKWRGASHEFIRDFKKHFKGALTSTILHTYRNSKKVTELANRISKSLLDPPVTTKNKEKGSVTLLPTTTFYDEAQKIVSILNLNEDNMILARTNSEILNIEIELINKDIQYYVINGASFMKNKYIRCLLSAALISKYSEMKLIEQWLSLIYMSGTYVPKQIIHAFEENGANLEAAKKGYGEFNEVFAHLSTYIALFKKTKYENMGFLLRNIYDWLHIKERITMNESTDTALTTIDCINKFCSYCSKFKTLDELFEFTAKSKKNNEEKTGVMLSTIHSAKGLEATNVFVIGQNFDERIEENLDEELRLFYVACTRARRDLVVSYVQVPSMFVQKYFNTEEISNEV